MGIMDLASKGICRITKNYGKKLQKTMKAPEIPEIQPFTVKGSAYSAGFSKTEIMPDLNSGKTYYIAGHGSGHVMEGVLTPVTCSAEWIDCGGDEGIFWVSADVIGLTRVEVNKIRSMIMASDKIKGCKCINISCTHSHSGIDTIGYWGKPNIFSIPADGKDPDYMKMLMEKIKLVCEEAYANRRPGKLYSGSVIIPDGLHDKRPPRDKHEVLSRIRFVPDDGSKEIWIMNFGAHPNSLGGSNRMLSGEYPHFMREKIYKSADAEVIYGIGPIGGMDAKQFCDDDKVKNIQLQGEMIADAALTIDNERELEPVITVLQQPFYMPIGNYVLTLLAMRHVMSCEPYPCSDGDVGIAMMTELTYMTLGDQKILLLPGENFVQTVYGGYCSAEESSTGLGADVNPPALADIAGDHNMITFGITNDMTGYVVPISDFVLNPTQPYLNGYKDRFGKNHYHETNSMGIGTQKVIADAFAAVVARVKK